ncbi:MAG: hypothetical protein DWQ05_11655 [Calditrichaeota bacterium]|nr:MAG: hypothetical protein DWQ05_11655 [Calditrichota bacterium]
MDADKKFKIHLGLLLISLVIVVSTLFYVKSLLRNQVRPDQFPNAVIKDNEFYHPWLGFSISVPSTEWEIEQRADQNYFGEEDTLLSVFTNMRPVVEFRKQVDSTSYALVEVAAIKLVSIKSAKELALRCRNDFLKQSKNARFEFLQNVTENLNGRYDAAYYVLQFNNAKARDIWIVTTVVSDSFGYIISAQLSIPGYETARFEIEEIIASFKLHAVKKIPAEIPASDDEYTF